VKYIHGMQNISTHSEVIEALGGVSRLVELTGVPLTTASMWRLRKSIPAKHWPAVLSEAQRLGHDLSLDRMVAMLPAKQQEPAQ
jgi:hypothetical protein